MEYQIEQLKLCVVGNPAGELTRSVPDLVEGNCSRSH